MLEIFLFYITERANILCFLISSTIYFQPKDFSFLYLIGQRFFAVVHHIWGLSFVYCIILYLFNSLQISFANRIHKWLPMSNLSNVKIFNCAFNIRQTINHHLFLYYQVVHSLFSNTYSEKLTRQVIAYKTINMPASVICKNDYILYNYWWKVN